MHESFTVQRDTLSTCQICIMNRQSTNINVFSWLLFFFKLRERERVVYKIWVYRRNGPKVTHLIFRWGSTGESFFFHGLIDFMLFLILAWRTWVPRVSDILLSSPWNTGFGSFARYEPCQTTNFLIIYFRWGEEVPTSVLGSQPIIWLLSSSSWCPATWVRSPSTNIWSPLRDLHSFLTVTLWQLDTVNSNTRSSNFISLLPVGYHVTIYSV